MKVKPFQLFHKEVIPSKVIFKLKNMPLIPMCHEQTKSLPSKSPGAEGEAGHLRAGKSC